MAIPSAYIQINFGGNGSNPSDATSFQFVTPWGQTQVCTTWDEAVNQAFHRHGYSTGKMGNYLRRNTNNGHSSTISGSATANDIISSDYN